MKIREERFRDYNDEENSSKKLDYLFPFISHGAINKRFNALKETFAGQIENIDSFKPHDTRSLHLSLIYEQGNI